MSKEQKEVLDREASSDEDVPGPASDPIDTESDSPEDDGDRASTGDFTLEELRALADQLEQSQDQIKRQAAEFQNYRRRTEQEKAQMVEFGKKLVVERLLDVIDDFRRSLDAAAEAAEDGETGPAFESLQSGVEMVYSKMMDELSKLGVETIDAVGERFDEDLHEALMQQPAPEGTDPGTVLAEIQKGYRLGDRVIRHARVVVATDV
ncbi:MAG: nucleotide exchange factor GrpE [Rhodothermales bacterium]|nr:nucleotide exchange factor GrpE [Rhodothermales bacterium]